ncbi:MULTISPECIES: zinc metallopeptidase [Nosocomiicoccus]|uniref:Zinc metallopeptidase n=1 Tax=Nosocomiicoccus massiliensis TaxID=1232430 RepID=A0AAF0YJ41_9STAP|nr:MULTISPECIES: zinc metallopeptidase [Nosocomiicoccus]MDK6862701.1 zinc metallopeptidase [Nosocomiicoccus ampullae]OFL46133.1 zinc metallopeptidase [Nosocomiicoccus sp. HMSC067E10]OFO55435.1 zinc metallopeptidase [Nosocomiicoccus sp. HMSC059G07]WOS96543.1 zinc metallopeptidase [Nosocomiicoccus massiliensis]
MLMYIIYFAILLIVPMLAQMNVTSTFRKYSRVRSTSGLTGKEVAELILRENGIYDVEVLRGKGHLTDHYDPGKKVVVLSPDNYDKPSVAGTAVAAHEVGHAIQHATGYKFLNLRAAIFPLAQFGSNFAFFLIMAGIVLTAGMQSSGPTLGTYLLWGGIGLFAFAVLFQIVTLPVEFDASNRAMKQIERLNIVNEKEYRHAKKVLSAAAMTYVAATATAIAELVRLILIARNN